MTPYVDGADHWRFVEGKKDGQLNTTSSVTLLQVRSNVSCSSSYCRQQHLSSN